MNERRKNHAILVFQAIDAEGTGRISREALSAYTRPENFEKVKVKLIKPEDFINDVMAKVDWQADGCIDLKGWLDLCADLR
jgi:Ca2+-binding EF-hand superfamily protein